VAASTISPATLSTTRERERRTALLLLGKALDYWHLLSLDAPTVAVAWTIGFAAALHVQLPVLGPVMLALATWLLYVADRLLDAQRPAHPGSLQLRHHFHQWHRRSLLTVAAVIVPLLVWLIATRLEAAPLREDLVLAGCSLVYLLCVHFPLGCFARARIRLPKEMIVGIIFAAACVIPTWSRVPLARPFLLPPLCLFAALCWINCVAIEFWESTGKNFAHLPRSTRWVGRHFSAVAGMIGGLAVVTTPLLLASAGGRRYTGLLILYPAVTVSCGALVWLHRRRQEIEPLRLRAAADAILLSPVFLLPMLPLLTRLHRA
jgi:hypothetical protein